jgi:hypothetical protein
MCHHGEFDREWGVDRDRDRDEKEDGIPSHLNEESNADVEVLTDGGEDDEE